MKRLLWVLGVVVGLALPAAAESPPASRAAGPPPAESPEAETYWRTRADEARARVAAAREQVATSETEYGKMRHRKRKRGEPRANITGARDAAYAELEAALHYLEVQLPEEARRAGALPGWLRE